MHKNRGDPLTLLGYQVAKYRQEIDEDAAKREFCGPRKRIEQHEMDQLDRDIDQARESGSRVLKKKLKLRSGKIILTQRINIRNVTRANNHSQTGENNF